MTLNENPTNSLISRLYSDLFLYCNKKKIPIFFRSAFKDTVFLQNVVEIPLELSYSPYKACKKDGCKNTIESISDYINYYLVNGNGKKVPITSAELLMLEGTLINTNSELEKLQMLTEVVFNTLHYFFDDYNLKLNSIKLKFMKADIFKSHDFICYFDFDDNPLDLTNISNGKKVDTKELLTILYL